MVATTILENGIDIPNVNTIVIQHTHLFGLSQLHQLRGRVGRSNLQAYAYMMHLSRASHRGGAQAAPRAQARGRPRRRLRARKGGHEAARRRLARDGAEGGGGAAELGVDLYLEILQKAMRLERMNWDWTSQGRLRPARRGDRRLRPHRGDRPRRLDGRASATHCPVASSGLASRRRYITFPAGPLSTTGRGGGSGGLRLAANGDRRRAGARLDELSDDSIEPAWRQPTTLRRRDRDRAASCLQPPARTIISTRRELLRSMRSHRRRRKLRCVSAPKRTGDRRRARHQPNYFKAGTPVPEAGFRCARLVVNLA